MQTWSLEGIARGARVDERPVRGGDRFQDPLALAVQAGRGRRREDRVAFELDEGEGRSEAHDHGVEQRPEHRIRRRDPGAEVDAVFLLDPGHEAGVAGDVGEQQVSLGGRRIRRGQLGSYRVVHALPCLSWSRRQSTYCSGVTTKSSGSFTPVAWFGQ